MRRAVNPQRHARHNTQALLGKGFGKLPGDLRFKLFGKERYIPLTTTILLSLVASIVSQLI